MIFDSHKWGFQVKFKNRVSAATILSEVLEESIKKIDRKSILVLGIVRSGVVTADIIVKRLAIPNFDIIFPKKLTDPDNKEQAIGAIIDDENVYILQDLVKDFQIPEEYLKMEIAFQINEINQRKRKYFKTWKSYSISEKIKNTKTIILVDDGIFSGATMTVAIKWIFQICSQLGIPQRRIILAAPVVPKNVAERLRNEFFVEVVTVFTPSYSSFHSVEQYHLKFPEITDENVMNLMKGDIS